MDRLHALLPLAAAALVACGGSQNGTGGTTPPPTAAAPTLFEPTDVPETLTVVSGAFADGEPIPQAHAFSGMGCTGTNLSPPLAWSNVPEGTQSFAVIAHDPDAPTGVGFFHWTLFDLPGDVTALPEGFTANQRPPAVEAHTDFGATGYGGPCPPPGETHRYYFSVYALDTPSLGMGATATGALLRFAVREHALAFGRVHGTYARPE